MTKGSALKAMWANPEWREQRIAELTAAGPWLQQRMAGLEKAVEYSKRNRKLKSNRKNYDLVRQNAIMFYEYHRMKLENERLKNEIEDVCQTFGVKGDLNWSYMATFGLTRQQSEVLSLIMSRAIVTIDQLDFAARRDKARRATGRELIGSVVKCNLRKRLRKFGIEITTIYGEGVLMSAENKAKVRALTIGPHGAKNGL